MRILAVPNAYRSRREPRGDPFEAARLARNDATRSTATCSRPVRKWSAPPTTSMTVEAQPSVAWRSAGGGRNWSRSGTTSSFGLGSCAAARREGGWRTGGAIAAHPATRSSATQSTVSAPNDQPTRPSGKPSVTGARASMAATTSSRSASPRSCDPAEPPTPRKLKRRQTTPVAGRPANRALVTIERMDPPWSG